MTTCERCDRPATTFQADVRPGEMLIRTDLGERWCNKCADHVNEYHAQHIGWSLGLVCDGVGNERDERCLHMQCSCPVDWTFRFGTAAEYVRTPCDCAGGAR